MKCFKCLFLLLSVFFALNVNAQNMTVKGTITDGSNGDPIPFASVVVKGMTIWTTSDAEGRYTIEAPATAVFTVSCLGYKEAEIAVNGRSALQSQSPGVTITQNAGWTDASAQYTNWK